LKAPFRELGTILISPISPLTLQRQHVTVVGVVAEAAEESLHTLTTIGKGTAWSDD
jgi:hypothetical protein